MAVIASNAQQAEVVALGRSMRATVNFSGALMEMLATTYVYILMAGIREAIQNACDASRRAGLPFSKGVLVVLPTKANPMITIIDQGSGMTQSFMEDPEGGYLSFGSTTKAGDNGAAGGLGVGRWAAYGYIRECYITTCHASDMVSRTYFQFQGDDQTPNVQLASEVPGTEVGTKVFFPVKESDLDEALRAVAWLKGVMELTMGDSFAVDNPGALPNVLPAFGGTVLDLGSEDAGLAGVLVYPMKGTSLKYGRQGLQEGSLVVLTNKEAGVGGLPFHVQSPTDARSVFANGMVIEVPLSFGVPFMPSREEIKYTDHVDALLKRIDEAAQKAVVAKVEELYRAPNLACKAALSDLLGNETEDKWHAFARSCRDSTAPLFKGLQRATGGSYWDGQMKIPFVTEMSSDTLSVKSTSTTDLTLRTAFRYGGHLAVSLSAKHPQETVYFHPNNPVTLVVNDLKTGGTARFRQWLKEAKRSNRKRSFVFFTSDTLGEAQIAADALNAVWGGALAVCLTSTMPEVARMVLGSAVVASRSKAGSLTYYCTTLCKQELAVMGYATYSSSEPVRVWLGKDGGSLSGYKDGYSLTSLMDKYAGSLAHVLNAAGISKLYLLTPKQVIEMEEAKASVQADGLWELDDGDFASDDEGQEALRAVKALKGWKTLDELLAEVVDSKPIQDLLAGRRMQEVTEDYTFNQLVAALAKRPRMELTGTSLDNALSPYIDLLSGKSFVHQSAGIKPEFRQLVQGLNRVCNAVQAEPTDSTERQALHETLAKVAGAGKVNYGHVFKALQDKYPLLHGLSNLKGVPDSTVDHLCLALAAVYR